MRFGRWQPTVLVTALVATFVLVVPGTATAAPVTSATAMPRHSDVVGAINRPPTTTVAPTLPP